MYKKSQNQNSLHYKTDFWNDFYRKLPTLNQRRRRVIFKSA